MGIRVDFPDIIEMISQLQQTNWRFITVRKLRKLFKIESEDAKMIRKLSNTLVWLAHYGYLEVIEDCNPKRYRILPDFAQRVQDIVRIYRK